MKHKKRGVAIVINNKNFDNPTLSTRDGTDRDRLALDLMFQQMEFDFICKSNKTKQVLLEC